MPDVRRIVAKEMQSRCGGKQEYRSGRKRGRSKTKGVGTVESDAGGITIYGMGGWNEKSQTNAR